MIPLAVRATTRYLRRHPAQLALVILGVALGVAVVVAVDLANAAAARAFALSSEAVAGRATHQIVGGPAGVDDAVYVRLRRAGITDAAPLVEAYGRARGPAGDETLQLLGVDPLAEAHFRAQLEGLDARVLRRLLTEPDTVLLADITARRLGLHPGDRLELRLAGRTHSLTLLALLPSRDAARGVRDGMLIADIATAQELANQVGRVSWIDVVIPEGAGGERLRENIAKLLPPDATVQTARARGAALAQLTRAFRINLTAMSLLALVVGTFLIYNTMTFSVLQRRALIGGLRALGVTRAQVFRLILTEALAVGLVGGAFGVALGLALGTGLVRLVARTINDLYFVVQVTGLPLLPVPLMKGFALGLLATVAAALIPAVEAAGTSPRLALRRSAIESRARRFMPWFALLGAAMTGVAALLLVAPARSLLAGFAALFLLILGLTLATPLAVAGLVRIGNVLVARLGLAARLAVRSIGASLSRTGVAIAALMLAVAASVGVGVMVASLRGAVDAWLAATLSADIYVSTPGFTAQRSPPQLEPQVIAAIRQVPGVEAASAARYVQVDSSFGPTELLALDAQPRRGSRFMLKEGDPGTVWPAYDAGRGIVITEPYAYRHGLGPGDAVTLRTRTGPLPFPVIGVLVDYSTEQGMIVMNRVLYRQHFDDPAISSLRLYLAPDAAFAPTLAAVRAAARGDEAVVIRSNRELRRTSLEIFDRTFTITRVLRLLAIAVAFVGILSALMALQLERAREFALLRAQGMTRGEVQGMVSVQTGVMGLIAGVLALPAGWLLALVLIHVINRRAFGWSLQTVLPVEVLVQAVTLAVVAALIAGLYPGWRLAHARPAQALREE